MNDFLENLKSIINDYIHDFKNNIKDVTHYLGILHEIIDYFRYDSKIIYEVIIKAKCDAIYNDIKEIANLPYYLTIYFLILILYLFL